MPADIILLPRRNIYILYYSLKLYKCIFTNTSVYCAAYCCGLWGSRRWHKLHYNSSFDNCSGESQRGINGQRETPKPHVNKYRMERSSNYSSFQKKYPIPRIVLIWFLKKKCITQKSRWWDYCTNDSTNVS